MAISFWRPEPRPNTSMAGSQHLSSPTALDDGIPALLVLGRASGDSSTGADNSEAYMLDLPRPGLLPGWGAAIEKLGTVALPAVQYGLPAVQFPSAALLSGSSSCRGINSFADKASMVSSVMGPDLRSTPLGNVASGLDSQRDAFAVLPPSVASSLSAPRFGTPEAETISGTDRPDNIFGLGGDDLIYGWRGADTLFGGDGHDTLVGGIGNDLLAGDRGPDVYYVKDFGDVVVEKAGGGIDTVCTRLTSYTLGAHVENLQPLVDDGLHRSLVGNSLDNQISGASANEVLAGLEGNDQLDGYGGHDALAGGAGEDWLFGWTGNDRLDGGQGADELFGGAGHDSYTAKDLLDRIVEDANHGIDTVLATTPSFTLPENVEYLTFMGSQTATGIGNGAGNLITAGTGAVVFHGRGGGDTLRGSGSMDDLYGGVGDDVLVGDFGGDSLFGGSGKDLLLGGEGPDSLIGDTGNDDLRGGNGNDQLVGGTANDRLDGGLGSDVLYGDGRTSSVILGGNDILIGGRGTDIMSGGAGGDTFVFGEGDSGTLQKDRILDFGHDSAAARDRIDLSQIDPSSNATALRWSEAPNVAGTVWFEAIGPQNGLLKADITADGIADFSIDIWFHSTLAAAAFGQDSLLL